MACTMKGALCFDVGGHLKNRNTPANFGLQLFTVDFFRLLRLFSTFFSILSGEFSRDFENFPEGIFKNISKMKNFPLREIFGKVQNFRF